MSSVCTAPEKWPLQKRSISFAAIAQGQLFHLIELVFLLLYVYGFNCLPRLLTIICRSFSAYAYREDHL